MGEMHAKSDVELLRDYAACADESAFREIVRRHADLVYASASRQVNSPDLAHDVAQEVFTDLTRKASSLVESLTTNASLLGWLYRSTRFVALNQLRDDRRRESRERLAMQDFDPTPETMPEWDRVRPVLDEAMADLNEEDREALLLRYFKNHDFRTIGAEIGVSDDAAQKRVSRALERLRAEFNRRGMTTTAVALSTMLSVNAAPAAPIGLATAISTAALTGPVVATATTTLVMTTLQKAIIGATLAVAVGTGIYQARQAAEVRGQLQALQGQETSVNESMGQIVRERDVAMAQLAVLRGENERLNRDHAELLKLRGQIGLLRRELADAKDSIESLNDTNGLAKVWSVGEIKSKAVWKNAGLSSPLAALETFWWAAANRNVEEMNRCLVFDSRTNAEPVSEKYAKRELNSASGLVRLADGIRLLSQSFGITDSNRATIEIVLTGAWPLQNGTTVSTMANETFQLLRVVDEWKVVRAPGLMKLSIFDDDSEDVAKVMLRLDPKTLQQVIADPQLPLRTLRAYEALKARSSE